MDVKGGIPRGGDEEVVSRVVDNRSDPGGMGGKDGLGASFQINPALRC